jgi:hypothetical protein
MALVAGLTGCESPNEVTHIDAPDGFYVAATGTAAGYTLKVVPPSGGRALTFGIQSYVGFLPQHVVVFDTPDGYCVQISGRAAVENWLRHGIILVANHKPYFELNKSGQAVSATRQRIDPSATISLVLRTRKEADAVATALRRRYSL